MVADLMGRNETLIFSYPLSLHHAKPDIKTQCEWISLGSAFSCQFFLHGMFHCDHYNFLQTQTNWGKVLVAQSCLTVCDLMDCSLPGSLSMGFSRQKPRVGSRSHLQGSSWPRDQTWVSCIFRQILYCLKPLGKGLYYLGEINECTTAKIVSF